MKSQVKVTEVTPESVKEYIGKRKASIKPSKLDVKPKNMGSFKEITIEAKYHGFTPEKIGRLVLKHMAFLATIATKDQNNECYLCDEVFEPETTNINESKGFLVHRTCQPKSNDSKLLSSYIKAYNKSIQL